jgi:ubiquinone/menaquinone biosynthesis C-methylase UbiE
MASNQEKIISHYSSFKEDNRANESRSSNLEFHYTKKFLSEYISPKSNVIELGCATGYYGMFFADKCSEYVGVDISPNNIAIFNEKIAVGSKKNVSAVVGDATDLVNISDNSFDIVLCLGPMYHLPREERLKVFHECYRIAQPGAILAFAYINGLGAYLAACVHDKLRSTYPNAETNQSVFEFKTDDQLPGVFFFTSPDEMENDAMQKKLEVLKNCGVNFHFAACAVDMMSEEQFECYMVLADKMSDNPSCVGLSAHALLICKK